MHTGPFTVLLVGEANGPWGLTKLPVDERFQIRSAAQGEVAPLLRDAEFDAVLVFAERYSDPLARSIKLWKGLRPRAQFLVLLEHPASTRSVVSLMHAGCQDVIDRPSADMANVLESLEERIRFVQIHQIERLRAKQSVHYTGLIGESPEMVRIYDEMLRAAKLASPVLLSGETGTGKGLAAHAIHALSQRRDKPFVTVDCGCLSPTLIESELYGVARGAFTGATSSRPGLVETAQQGTLFLDEIEDLPLGLQPKLLRLLEEGEVRRLGSPHAVPVDVRVISATSRELESLIAANRFRLDLYYRLNVLSIEIAPLRQRRQDIPLLARHFASRHVIQGEPVSVSDAAIEILQEYSWPGNVRELKNCIEAAIASASGPLIQPQNLPPRLMRGVHPARPGEPVTVNLQQLERRAIRTALELAAHDKVRAARLLGIGKTTLYRKLKEMTIEEEPRETPARGDYLM